MQNWKAGKLFSDKIRRDVDVIYECRKEACGKLVVFIRPPTAQPGDPEGDFYFASFVVEDEFVRATMLERNNMASLKGITHALLKAVETHIGKKVRSSLLYTGNEPVRDADDQLMGYGPRTWQRFVRERRATYSEEDRRFYLK